MTSVSTPSIHKSNPNLQEIGSRIERLRVRIPNAKVLICKALAFLFYYPCPQCVRIFNKELYPYVQILKEDIYNIGLVIGILRRF